MATIDRTKRRQPNRAGKGHNVSLKTKEDSLEAWLDHEADSDAAFKARVQERMASLRLKEGLVKIRRERGLTQAEMSRRARVSQAYLAKLEAGRITNPELMTLARLATAANVPVTSLLAGVDESVDDV